jgi:hypothetical protein
MFLPSFEPLLRKRVESKDPMRGQLHVPSYIEGVTDFVANASAYTKRGVFIDYDSDTSEVVISVTTTDIR